MKAALAAVLAVLLLPGAAAAAPGAEVGIEDERLLLSEPDEAPEVVAAWKAAGIDVVRLHARWEALAPGRSALRRPRGFRAADHTDPRYDFAALDRAVGLVRASGIRVMLTVTGPGPLWSSRVPSMRKARYRPSPRAFAAFAAAVASRYGAEVDRYLLWNEPNQHGWLEPQWSCRGRGSAKRCRAVAPHVYRALVRAAKPAIERADRGAQVLIGEMAPIGRRPTSTVSPIAPIPFLRAMACVDRAYRPVRTGACRRFRPAAADAFGHHPHGVRNAPDQPNPDPEEAQIADLPRLLRVLDRLTRSGRIVAPRRRLAVYLTEFGYQTSPPDHAIGVTLAQQLRYLQLAAYLTWRTPRVRNLTHYQWRDEPVFDRGAGKKGYAGWQSGLRYVDGRPKPAMAAFAHPFVVHGSRFWGHVRPADGRVPVRIQRWSHRAWRTVASATTDRHGYWTRRLRVVRGARYRYAWGDDADRAYGGPERRVSGTVTVRGPRRRMLSAAVSRAAVRRTP